MQLDRNSSNVNSDGYTQNLTKSLFGSVKSKVINFFSSGKKSTPEKEKTISTTNAVATKPDQICSRDPHCPATTLERLFSKEPVWIKYEAGHVMSPSVMTRMTEKMQQIRDKCLPQKTPSSPPEESALAKAERDIGDKPEDQPTHVNGQKLREEELGGKTITQAEKESVDSLPKKEVARPKPPPLPRNPPLPRSTPEARAKQRLEADNRRLSDATMLSVGFEHRLGANGAMEKIPIPPSTPDEGRKSDAEKPTGISTPSEASTPRTKPPQPSTPRSSVPTGQPSIQANPSATAVPDAGATVSTPTLPTSRPVKRPPPVKAEFLTTSPGASTASVPTETPTTPSPSVTSKEASTAPADTQTASVKPKPSQFPRSSSSAKNAAPPDISTQAATTAAAESSSTIQTPSQSTVASAATQAAVVDTAKAEAAEKMTTKSDELTHKVNKRFGEISDLTKKLETAKTYAERVSEQLEEASQDLSDLLKEKIGNDPDVSTINKEIEYLNKEMEELLKEKNKSDPEVISINKEIENLNKKLNKLIKEKIGSDPAVILVNEKIKNLNAVVGKANQIVNKLQAEIDVTISKLKKYLGTGSNKIKCMRNNDLRCKVVSMREMVVGAEKSENCFDLKLLTRLGIADAAKEKISEDHPQLNLKEVIGLLKSVYIKKNSLGFEDRANYYERFIALHRLVTSKSRLWGSDSNPSNIILDQERAALRKEIESDDNLEPNMKVKLLAQMPSEISAQPSHTEIEQAKVVRDQVMSDLRGAGEKFRERVLTGKLPNWKAEQVPLGRPEVTPLDRYILLQHVIPEEFAATQELFKETTRLSQELIDRNQELVVQRNAVKELQKELTSCEKELTAQRKVVEDQQKDENAGEKLEAQSSLKEELGKLQKMELARGTAAKKLAKAQESLSSLQEKVNKVQDAINLAAKEKEIHHPIHKSIARVRGLISDKEVRTEVIRESIEQLFKEYQSSFTETEVLKFIEDNASKTGADAMKLNALKKILDKKDVTGQVMDGAGFIRPLVTEKNGKVVEALYPGAGKIHDDLEKAEKAMQEILEFAYNHNLQEKMPETFKAATSINLWPPLPSPPPETPQKT